MKKDDLGTRMKGYEFNSRHYLINKMPVIIRIDGKAFHTFTRGMAKPFDDILMQAMQKTTKFLCENIQNCKLGYTQSDEISLLLIDYENIKTNSWFENNIQKIVSISASMATYAFNKFFNELVEMKYTEYMTGRAKILPGDLEKFKKVYRSVDKYALFDSRAYNVPKEEVCNYFIWRQQDATRNSIQMVAQANFSHSQLQGQNCNKLQDKLFLEKEINWNDFATPYKRGICVGKALEPKTVVTPKGNETINRSVWKIDNNIPIFTKDRCYIESIVWGTTDK